MSAGGFSVRAAATVVLVTPGSQPEILFLRRHGKSAFMANAYVFPGGRVDEQDAGDTCTTRLTGTDLSSLQDVMVGLDDERAIQAHLVAAIRETFEEAGVLLARRADGGRLTPLEAGGSDDLAAWREELSSERLTFGQLLDREDLHLDGGALKYFAHWITPEQEPRRFDARFFLARAPAHQLGSHDGQETTDSIWRSPDTALQEHQAGRFMLAPPTWSILRELGSFPEFEAMWEGVPVGGRVAPVCPHMTSEDGAFVLALPGDRLHPETHGGREHPRRIIMRAGHWSDR